MSTGWSLYIIIGTLGSLLWCLWLLFSNRKRVALGEEVKTTGHEYDGIEEYDNPLPAWWVGMFVATVVFALLYLVYYPGLGNFTGVGGWTSTEQWQAEVERNRARFGPLYEELAALSPAEVREHTAGRRIGRRLFVNNCATCHGVTAEGTFGFPNLTDAEWNWGGDFAAIKTTITQGRTGVMTPWGPALGDDGVNDVADHVLALAGRDHDAAAAERGATQYATFCIACHGLQGKGNALLGAPDLTNDLWQYGGSREQISFTIKNGRTGIMPGHADLLGTEQIHVLSAYVEGLAQ
jgi:cytochrome c oxidase cbb3-type subunit 3